MLLPRSHSPLFIFCHTTYHSGLETSGYGFISSAFVFSEGRAGLRLCFIPPPPQRHAGMPETSSNYSLTEDEPGTQDMPKGVTFPRGGVSWGPPAEAVSASPLGKSVLPLPKLQDGPVMVKEGTLESLGCPDE